MPASHVPPDSLLRGAQNDRDIASEQLRDVPREQRLIRRLRQEAVEQRVLKSALRKIPASRDNFSSGESEEEKKSESSGPRK